jgi:hypothetical protein
MYGTVYPAGHPDKHAAVTRRTVSFLVSFGEVKQTNRIVAKHFTIT